MVTRKTLIILIPILLIFITAISIHLLRPKIEPYFFKPNISPTTKTTPQNTSNQKEIETIAENLNIPWGIAILPDNSLLVTQRSGELLLIDQDVQTIQKIPGVNHVGEGGLLGITLHPQYSQNNWIYLYLTSESAGKIINRVIRYSFENNTLKDPQVIIDNIPGATYHDGGLMRFGPDGYLYITTGDAQVPDSAQDTGSLSGKILRIESDGATPEDNPFGNEVYSYGHRNPQGLAWDSSGQLYSTEHGPSGTNTGYDELNLIEKGGNYGWPLVYGSDTYPGTIEPIIQSGSTETWAPASLIFYNGKFYFTGLRGQALFEVDLDGKTATPLYFQQFGRLRALVASPDGNSLYVSTSNRDGRGSPSPTDDKVIKLSF